MFPLHKTVPTQVNVKLPSISWLKLHGTHCIEFQFKNIMYKLSKTTETQLHMPYNIDSGAFNYSAYFYFRVSFKSTVVYLGCLITCHEGGDYPFGSILPPYIIYALNDVFRTLLNATFVLLGHQQNQSTDCFAPTTNFIDNCH